MTATPDMILHNAKLTTLDRATPLATAFAVQGGHFVAVGDAADIMGLRGPTTRVIDAGGRPVGLIDIQDLFAVRT